MSPERDRAIPEIRKVEGLPCKIWEIAKDVGVAFVSVHILYAPFTRLNFLLRARFTDIPRSVIEKSYNDAIIGFFGERGKRFLAKIGRLEQWGYTEPKAKIKEITVSQALKELQSPPSPSLRRVALNLPTPDQLKALPWVGATPLLTLSIRPDAALDRQELTRRYGALRKIIDEVANPGRRSRRNSEVHRSKIATAIGGIYHRSRHGTEVLPTLPYETRGLLFSLAWMATMEGSPPVLKEAAYTSGIVLECWLERKIGKTTTQEKQEEITDGEAILIAKSLVSISFRRIPEARDEARRIMAGLQAKIANANESVRKDPNVEYVHQILELSQKFVQLPRTITDALDIQLGMGENVFPVEHDLARGVSTIVLPPGNFLNEQVDKAACLVALRFPVMNGLEIVQGDQLRKKFFSVPMEEFYRSRLLGGKVPPSYKPAQSSLPRPTQ